MKNYTKYTTIIIDGFSNMLSQTMIDHKSQLFKIHELIVS